MASSKQSPVETITDAIYTVVPALFANTPVPAESLLHRQKKAAGEIGLHVNANKTEFKGFKQECVSGKPLELVDKFTYLSSNISSTEKDVNICLAKA